MKRVFILDDLRSVQMAMADAGFIGRSSEPPEAHYTIARCLEDGFEMVRLNPRFDLWVLDNDLGIREGVKEEGMEFLKLLMVRHPEKVPDEVVSCSANWQRRETIVSFFANWVKNGRASALPIGVDP